MKKIFFVAVLAMAVFAGCKKDDPEPEAVKYLTVDKSDFNIGPYSGSKYVNIESNTNWTVSPHNYGIQNLSISPLSGSNNGSICVQYGEEVSATEMAVLGIEWVKNGSTQLIEVTFHR